jgi:hypothetical protein
MTIRLSYFVMPYLCDWKHCTQQAILRKWFREAGSKEFNLCANHAEKVSYLLHKAREYETQHPPGGR